MDGVTNNRTPGVKLILAMAVAFLLTIPLFSIWLLVYDRQSQSETARTSIAEGWGGPQSVAGPLLVIPYRQTITDTETQDNKPVVRTRTVWKELTLSPEVARLSTSIDPQRRKRSIYEVVVYEAKVQGQSRFTMPADLQRLGIAPADLALDRAEIRFGLSDPRGLYGEPPRVTFAGRTLPLEPGNGAEATGGAGFSARVDASRLATAPMLIDHAFGVRGNGRLSLVPQAGDTQWKVSSTWPSPSFQGGFLPASRDVGPEGFSAHYQVGNLALGQSLVSTGDVAPVSNDRSAAFTPDADTPGSLEARIELVQPVDLYSQVDRSVKYGFLFIGFTFMALLLFDVVGGVRVSPVEYLLVGVALILFFVLLLAFAEVIGFAAAYAVAGAAIVGLNTAYSAAVLKSWRRAGFIGALLTALYGVLYVLLSLEDYSLLIGSLMLFAALAAVMYLTRHINWGARPEAAQHIE